MAKEITIKAKVEGIESVNKTINAFTKLKTELKAAKGELASFDVGTEGFKKAQKRIQDLQDQLGDLGDTMKIEGSGVERLSSSFGLLTESFNTADFGKAKIAFQGIGDAMKAVPIFLLIEGIKLLVENFDTVLEVFKSFTVEAQEQATSVRQLNTAFGELAGNLQEIEDLEEGLSRNLEFQNKLRIEKAKQRGATEAELAKVEVENNEKKLKLISNVEANYRAQKEYADSQYLKAINTGDEKAIEQAKALYERAESLHKASLNKKKDFVNEAEIFIQEKETESIIRKKEADKKAYAEFVKHRDEETAKRLEALYQQSQVEKAENEKRKAEDKALSDAILKNLKDTLKKESDEMAKQADKEFIATENKRASRKAQYAQTLQDRLLILEQEKNAVLNNTELTEQQRVAIIRKYNEDVKKLNKEALTESLNNVQKFTNAMATVANNIVGVFQSAISLMQQNRQQELDAFNRDIDTKLTNLNDAKDLELEKEDLTNEQKKAIQEKYALAEYELKLQQYNAETEVKRKAFEQDKKLKIATTVISTITGSVSALVGMIQSIPGPIGIILGAVSAAAVIAMGAIQIAQIKKQKFDAGSPPAPPKLGGGASGAGANSNTANKYTPPDLQQVGANANGNSNGEKGNPNTEPQKVYVVSSDITNQQNKDEILKRRATF